MTIHNRYILTYFGTYVVLSNKVIFRSLRTSEYLDKVSTISKALKIYKYTQKA